ncbi:hypothetical protein RND71_032816 [Anisodus tanguticus]|uniref:Uncharacterized protein n=1 Tax=Anisodus tanguticus TaxID=243964 RepID=A0AAE1UWY1_9SOLA|nr:hypothetical protein RND71_032816 [Anisodus tanguticus]
MDADYREVFGSRSRWGCQITDRGLYQLSTAKCISNLLSLSLWGTTGITDTGVVQLNGKELYTKILSRRLMFFVLEAAIDKHCDDLLSTDEAA